MSAGNPECRWEGEQKTGHGINYSWITANVGTEGANKKNLFWELYCRSDRLPHISLSFGQMTSKHIPFFQNNSCTISDAKENKKTHFISPFGTGATVSVQHLLTGWALVQTH
jgi:hypothetical protein